MFQKIRPSYRKVLTAWVQLYYALEGKNLEFFVEGSTVVFRSHSRPTFEARLSPEGIYSNTTFLVTLILVTPGMRLRRRGAYLAIGMALLHLTHIVF